MVLVMQKIVVGQIYTCTQSAHKMWVVKVEKVSANHVEVEVLEPVGGEHENYQTDQFIRDFELVKDVPEELPESKEKTCAQCHVTKPLDEFQKTYARHGKNKGQHMGYTKNCETCIGENRAHGQKTRTQPEVQVTLPLAESLSQSILQMATQVEELENYAKDRPKYDALIQTCSDMYRVADETHGVYIIPGDVFVKFIEALDSIR